VPAAEECHHPKKAKKTIASLWSWLVAEENVSGRLAENQNQSLI